MPYPDASARSQTNTETGLDPERNKIADGTLGGNTIANAHTYRATSNSDGLPLDFSGPVVPEQGDNSIRIAFDEGSGNTVTATVRIAGGDVESYPIQIVENGVVADDLNPLPATCWSERPGFFTPTGLTRISLLGQIPGIEQIMAPEAGKFLSMFYECRNKGSFASPTVAGCAFSYNNPSSQGWSHELTVGATASNANLRLRWSGSSGQMVRAADWRRYIDDGDTICDPIYASPHGAIINWDNLIHTLLIVDPSINNAIGLGNADRGGTPADTEIDTALFARVGGSSGSPTYSEFFNAAQSEGDRHAVRNFRITKADSYDDAVIDERLRFFGNVPPARFI